MRACKIKWNCPFCGGRCFVNDEHTRAKRGTTQYFHLLCAFPTLTPQRVRETEAAKEAGK